MKICGSARELKFYFNLAIVIIPLVCSSIIAAPVYEVYIFSLDMILQNLCFL